MTAAALVKLLGAVVVLAAGLLVTLALFQTRILFPVDAVPPAGPLPGGAERLAVQTPDGHRLHGAHFPPAGGTEPGAPRTLILGFGGNAWNAEDVAATLHRLYPHAHVVAFHFRGYRPSSGRPSARALLADAPLVHDAAVARVKPGRTVAVGFSIGSGIAASLARQRQLDGLILVTPFDSLKAVAAGHFPWLPIGLLFNHDMDVAGFIDGSQVPVAIIAAGRDEVIPRSRTDALRARVPNLVFDRTIASARHNDLYARAEFAEAMGDALAATAR